MLRLIKIIIISFFLTLNFQSVTKSAQIQDYDDNFLISSLAENEVMQIKNIAPLSIENMDFEFPDYHQKLPKEIFICPSGKIYQQSSFYVDLIDPKAGDPGVNLVYPGYRGANQLIIYTPDFGSKTNTNEFGAEVVVVNNTVVRFSGADSVIPKGGFIISGHGKAKDWIRKNVTLGSKIYFEPENMRITSFITPETYIFEANEKIKETSQVMQYYRMMDVNYDGKKASNFLFKADEYIKKAQKHPEKAINYLNLSKETVEIALKNAIPYKQDEFTGIWVRPVENNPREIENTVNRIKDAGIKNVFLETYYHGQTIYPSKVLEKYGVISQRGEFIGFDPLRVWIDECHKHRIKIHIWFECFYVGNKPPRSSRKQILSVYPDWANTTKSQADSSEIAYSAAEHNGYFVDPANPEVQKFLGEILTEIIEEYCPDGINLDYIRYPQCAQIKSDFSSGTEWGYTKYARNEFEKQFGVDPVCLKVSDPLRQNWFEFRQNKITDFVKFARKLTYKNNIMLTTVVFPDRNRCLETKLQDWKTWSKYNLVDGFTPLILTTDKKTAGSIIRAMRSDMLPDTKIYPGIFVMFMNAPCDELLLQIHEARKMHSDGVVLFDYAHFCSQYEDAVSTRVFNKKD